MSRAEAKVYFKDGTVLHWIYNWTIDVYMPKLYKTTDKVWEEFYSRYNDEIEVWYNFEYTWWEDCILYDSYWLGDYYIWKASKKDRMINKDFIEVYAEDDEWEYIVKNITKEEAEKYLWYKIIE